jgi:hypothetical protein
MNHSVKQYTVLTCLITALSGPALAQQPPDVVKSDSLANTAIGTNALLHVSLDEYGCHNTASGEDALYSDTSGSYNTATGFSALYSNTTGENNTSAGYESLYSNSTGSNNTASGYQSLHANTTGRDNTASGFMALSSNKNGAENAAIGSNTLESNTDGSDNAAQGYAALYSNTTGSYNTALGDNALYANRGGSYNTAVGYNAGSQATGTDNIYLANTGAAGESHTLRLGTQGRPGVEGSGILTTYIAGIASTRLTGSAVYVDSQGQLGVLASSERFKTDVKTMGGASDGLDALRPVTFKLKTDPEGTVQYGLIAEEVATVYPELVTRDADGRISGVRYEELAPMLLNTYQEQQRKIAAQAAVNVAQAAEIQELKQAQAQLATRAELNDLQRQLQAALTALESESQLVAHR